GRVRPFLVAGLGLHVLRTGSVQMTNDTDRAYHWGAGVRFAVSPRVDVRVDLRHLLVPDRSLDGATSDFEATAGVSFKLGGAAPAPRVAVEVAVVLPPGDRDRDHVTDDIDAGPSLAEDLDGYEDADGCAELDNDSDGLVDTVDRCPLEAETRNEWRDDDGCADELLGELAGIGFQHDSSTIDEASTPLLDRALEILIANPKILVEISGHTSADGNAERNLALSLARAQAVEAWLVRHGIVETRILTVGHGAAAPIADNTTDAGRSKNRRIEFRILGAP
ncbi:MAG: OmpA family protein, partial [Deltaproteobacteria bacterium]|nr:OmpA family protein [Deltaproteobacteria bacterium]